MSSWKNNDNKKRYRDKLLTSPFETICQSNVNSSLQASSSQGRWSLIFEFGLHLDAGNSSLVNAARHSTSRVWTPFPHGFEHLKLTFIKPHMKQLIIKLSNLYFVPLTGFPDPITRHTALSPLGLILHWALACTHRLIILIDATHLSKLPSEIAVSITLHNSRIIIIIIIQIISNANR